MKRIYPAIKHPEYVKMLYLLFIAFLISMAEFNLTGGGEQFLLSQAMHPDTHILWIVGMMLLHFVFSTFSFFFGFTGRKFYPYTGDRRTFGANSGIDYGSTGCDCL